MYSVVLAERNTTLAIGIETILSIIKFKTIAKCDSESSAEQAVSLHLPDFVFFGPSVQVPKNVWALDKLRIILARKTVGPSELALFGTSHIVGFLHIDAGERQYRACVQGLLEDSSWIDPGLLSSLTSRTQPTEMLLTSRESQIVRMVR